MGEKFPIGRAAHLPELKGSAHDRGNPRADKLLGMDQSITRPDFLNATLLASGGLLLNSISPADLLAANANAHPE